MQRFLSNSTLFSVAYLKLVQLNQVSNMQPMIKFVVSCIYVNSNAHEVGFLVSYKKYLSQSRNSWHTIISFASFQINIVSAILIFITDSQTMAPSSGEQDGYVDLRKLHEKEINELRMRMEPILKKYPRYDTDFALLRWLRGQNFDIGTYIYLTLWCLRVVCI